MAAMAASPASSLLFANFTSTISNNLFARNPKPITFLPGWRISQTQRHSYSHVRVHTRSHIHSHDIAPSCSFSLPLAPNLFGNTTCSKPLKKHDRDNGRDVLMNGGGESVPRMAVGLGGVGVVGVVGAGMMMVVVVPELAHASEIVVSNVMNVDGASLSALVASEPKNALSLPTWVIHVASVVEWITAMGLVWRYGDTPGRSTWKGLSWGMVPLLGGAMCACTWHFFYNAQSLEVLVVLQAALTLVGNFTMWAAAFRIYQASQQQSKAP